MVAFCLVLLLPYGFLSARSPLHSLGGFCALGSLSGIGWCVRVGASDRFASPWGIYRSDLFYLQPEYRGSLFLRDASASVFTEVGAVYLP